MIDINLIPTALRKEGKGQTGPAAINLPKEVLLGVGIGLFLLMLMVHLILGAIWLTGMARLSSAQSQWQKVLPDKQQIDDMTKKSVDSKKKITILSDMTVNKSVFWAPKFNAISDLLPRGVWIRRMTLDKTGLTIEGSVVSKSQNEINNVGVFLSALRQDNNFMEGVSSLEVNSIQGEKNNSVDVTDFSVLAKLK